MMRIKERDWRRSQAILRLLVWRPEGLITNEEFASLTPETQRIVEDTSPLLPRG